MKEKSTRAPWSFVVRMIPLVALMIGPPVSALTLDQAVRQAIDGDGWIAGSHHQQQAKTALGQSAGMLPDPTFNAGVNGLPVNTFDLAQEPMTQMVVGVSQMIPRGNTLSLSQSRFDQGANLEPIKRAQRKAQVRLQVSQLWLDAWGDRRSIDLIESNRGLFEQLSAVAMASYVSSYGKARQQDLARAELELAQLDDRLTALRQDYETTRSGLLRWIEPAPDADLEIGSNALLAGSLLPERVAETNSDLARRLADHPSVALIDARVGMAGTDIDLAKQKYKPQWGLKAQYGARAGGRPDLFSVGVSVNLPLFSSARQDNQVSAATFERESVKTERTLTLRNLVSQYRSALAAYDRLEERLTLYRDRVLPQASKSAEAALTAYRSADGDFSEVVRARIAELNAQLKVIGLKVEKHKQSVRMDYLTTRIDAKDTQA